MAALPFKLPLPLPLSSPSPSLHLMTSCRREEASAIAVIGQSAHDRGWSSLSELCELLDLPEIDKAADIQFQHKRIKAGQWIFSSGDKFESVYIVKSGCLKALLLDESGHEQILGFPLKGDVLGIDGMHAKCYASHMVALTECELVVVPFSDLVDLGRKYALMQSWFYGAIGRELVREHAIVALLGMLGAEARVARFLIFLSERFQVMGYSGTHFNLHMTRQEMGSYLGLTLETVSRSLSALQDARLITINQRAVSLLNIELLRTLKKIQIPAPICATRHIENVPQQVLPRAFKRNNSIWSSLAIPILVNS